MRAGELKHRIAVLKLVAEKDSSGGNVETWQPFAPRLPAKFNNLSGNERRFKKFGGEAAEARVEFTIRYYGGIKASMRVVFGDDVYDIRHVNNFRGMNIWMILTCDSDPVADI